MESVKGTSSPCSSSQMSVVCLSASSRLSLCKPADNSMLTSCTPANITSGRYLQAADFCCCTGHQAASSSTAYALRCIQKIDPRAVATFVATCTCIMVVVLVSTNYLAVEPPHQLHQRSSLLAAQSAAESGLADRHPLLQLSGTSAGAGCSTASWQRLLPWAASGWGKKMNLQVSLTADGGSR